MIKPIGTVQGFGVGNNQAVSLDSALKIINKLNEVILFINEGRERETEDTEHGKWVDVAGGRTICNKCGNYPLYNYHGKQSFSSYCPYCGAKMDGANNDK